MCSTKRRFWKKVEVSSSNGCWFWTGHKHCKGHGQFYYKGRAHYAHRIAWILTFNVIPKEMYVLHRCDNPSCINPFHLFVGTQQDNVADMIAKGRMAYGEKRARKGETNGWSKLTNNDVRRIRGMRKEGMLLREIAVIFDVTDVAIGNIIKGKSWRHI